MWGVFWAICLTHWGRMAHICVSKLTILGSDNGLSPGRHQAIIWTNAEILLIGPLGTNFSEILIEIHTFSFKEMHLNMSSGKWCPFCLGLNVLTTWIYILRKFPCFPTGMHENEIVWSECGRYWWLSTTVDLHHLWRFKIHFKKWSYSLSVKKLTMVGLNLWRYSRKGYNKIAANK